MVKSSRAFTLIEMMVVIVLVGIVATVVFPRLFVRKPKAEWPNILDDLNNMVFFARQEAISDQKVYRLFFRSNTQASDFVVVEKEEKDPENPTKKIYEQVRSYYFETKYEFDESVKMVAFYSDGKEQFEANKNNAYCYVVHDGLVQDVMIRFVKKKNDKEIKTTFKMQPFRGEFAMYEGFLKPEK